MTSLKPHDVFGAYELERKLGVGGMAEVWLAHPVGPSASPARVVLKRLHPHLAEHPKASVLFRDEVRLAQQLDHPNIVRVFDGGRVGDDWFLAMEFIDGIDLRNAIEMHGGPLWPAIAAALVADACIGLQYAHTLKDKAGKPLKIVHRDISPDNLMVDRHGRVRLVDFGIARAETTEATTQTGLRKGKVRYMAPEYVNDHHADARSDVYSMGATLFELVTGQKPFAHIRSTAGVYAALVKEGLPRATTVRPSLPPVLDEIIAAATMISPNRRLASAHALEHLLRGFLSTFAPPTAEEIGTEVTFWKQRLMAGPLRPKSREAGSYGQLESTEMFAVKAADVFGSFAEEAVTEGRERNVHVAHQLDDTQFNIRVGEFAALDADTDPYHPAPSAVTDKVQSVVLDAELEAVAHRVAPAPGTRRKKKRKR